MHKDSMQIINPAHIDGTNNPSEESAVLIRGKGISRDI